MKKFGKISLVFFLCVFIPIIFVIAGCGDKEVLKYEYYQGTTVNGASYEGYQVSAVNTDISGNIIIPSEYEGKPVHIKVQGFSGCKLTSITLSEGFNSIGPSAFENCYVKTITIPTSVTSIGLSAFKGATSLYRIDYLGTIAQWKKIDIHTVVPSHVHVVCTDGEFEK